MTDPMEETGIESAYSVSLISTGILTSITQQSALHFPNVSISSSGTDMVHENKNRIKNSLHRKEPF